MCIPNFFVLLSGLAYLMTGLTNLYKIYDYGELVPQSLHIFSLLIQLCMDSDILRQDIKSSNLDHKLLGQLVHLQIV
jgi:hypothetical protein